MNFKYCDGRSYIRRNEVCEVCLLVTSLIDSYAYNLFAKKSNFG